MTYFENWLIGYTGLVGSNIVESQEIDLPEWALFHSRNIDEIGNHTFGNLICSAARWTKWKVNKKPDEDMTNINAIQTMLIWLRERVNKLVLISTVDVYPDRTGNEWTVQDVTQWENHPYGRNRRNLELFVKKNFPQNLILRLPGLFGNGIKKNALYDLMVSHRLDQVNPISVFQFYDLRRIWLHIRRMLVGMDPFDTEKTLSGSEINLVTEPISIWDINTALFQRVLWSGDSPVSYDVRTILRPSGYFQTRWEVLDDIRDFVDNGRLGENTD